MKRRSLMLMPLILPALGACRSVDIDESTTVIGVVETIDPRSREVLLRGAGGDQSGRLLSMVAGRGVRNLERIRPGDRVTARYYRAVAAEVVRPSSPSAPAFAGIGIERNPTTAERPGGEVTRVVSARVTVVEVDAASNSATFVGPSRIPTTIYAQRPEIRNLFRTLRVGEQLDVRYEDALAISIEPMG